MERSQIRILIVEDDRTNAEALVQVVQKLGFQPEHFKKPEDALSAARAQPFQAGIIDVMLPKMNGPDLVALLRPLCGDMATFPVFLMSGIFKDKAFMQEAIKKAAASAYWLKPINIDDVVKALEGCFAGKVEEARSPMERLMTNPNPSAGERVQGVTEAANFHGFELPRILSLLMQPGISTRLELKNSAGEPSFITISNGRVVGSEILDRKSFFGALLVEKGLVLHERLEAVMSSANPTKKRIGERLVEANLMSPHIIPIINTEQMAIRMSKLVADTFYEVKISGDVAGEFEGNLDWPQFFPFLSDWVSSKIAPQWLHGYFMKWMSSPIRTTARFTPNHPVWLLHPLARVPWMKEGITAGKPISELLAEHPTEEQLILGSVYILLTSEFIFFDPLMSKESQAAQMTRLKNIFNEMQKQNDFQVLGLANKANGTQVKKAYHDLSKAFHPDRVPKNAPPEALELTNAVFTRMTSAYNRLSDDVKRAEYIKELDRGQAEKVLQAETLLDEGKGFLKSGQPARAVEKFRLALTLRTPTPEMLLHTMWARLASITGVSHAEVMAEAEDGLNKIPPEERHNALYYFVKGFYQRHKGDYGTAKANLAHAVSQNPDFVEAKRELNLITIAEKDAKGAAKGDLSNVLSGFFKKK